MLFSIFRILSDCAGVSRSFAFSSKSLNRIVGLVLALATAGGISFLGGIVLPNKNKTNTKVEPRVAKIICLRFTF
jgi:hypothetical protein